MQGTQNFQVDVVRNTKVSDSKTYIPNKAEKKLIWLQILPIGLNKVVFQRSVDNIAYTYIYARQVAAM